MSDRRPELTRSTFQTVIGELTPTLRVLSEKLGIELRIQRASFSNLRGEIILEAATVSEQGVTMDKEAEGFLRYAHRFDLSPTDLGREFSCSAMRLRIVGLRPRSKDPVVCEQVGAETRSRYLLSAASVKLHLGPPDSGRAVPGSRSAGCGHDH